jgi:alpha-tubulin suppressor-like RCC1 family protein
MELANKQIADIAAGAKHSLALAADGSIYSWGCNRKGQIGLDELKGALKPKRPKNLLEK